MVSPLVNLPEAESPGVRCAAICGPTAAGKTAAVVALRRDHGLPIEAVNFDALQVYRQLQAGTAKPSAADLAAVPYHLIDCADPTEAMNAARWAKLADEVLGQIRDRGRWPVLVGGTGLYLRALLRGLADIPPVPDSIRQALAEQWHARGPQALHAELAAVDPRYAAMTPAQNRQRVLRALEVWQATGRPFSAWHDDHAAAGDRHKCWITLLDPPRQELHERIGQRAQAMALPLLTEVDALLAGGLPVDAPAMQALGYREAAHAVAEGWNLAHFAQGLAGAHRSYGKKQATWFRAQQVQRHLPHADLPLMAADLRAWFAV